MKMIFARIARSAAGLIGAAVLLAGLAASPAAAQEGPPPPPSAAASLDEELSEPEAPPERSRRGGRPGRVRSHVTPYIEVNAGFAADLANDDVVTYAGAAAGVTARVETRRVTAQASYRYDRRIALEGELPDSDAHSGVAMVHAEAAPGVSLDAGAMATRSGGAGRPVPLAPTIPAVEVYSAYAGPTLNTRVGELTVGAAYRLGYVHIDDDDGLSGETGGSRFDDSIAHNATASIGMGPGGSLPFGWTVGGSYVRESFGEFENRFQAAYIRGDIVLPVGPTLALTAGVGYEDIEASQQDVLRDENGVPILVNGRLVADPNAPRLSAFDRSGIIYDGGIIWRPSPRTELQARAGRRYGGTTFAGSLRHRFNPHFGMNASVYDSVGTTGTAIVNAVSQLPANFEVGRNPLTGGFEGCVFGADPGTGICFDQALQALSGASYRSRGGNLVFSGGRGPWNFGFGGGYSHRRYFQPVSGDLSSLDPRSDQSFALNAGFGRRLSRYSGFALDASAGWFDSDRTAFDPIFSTGVTGSYYRSFLIERLQFHSALGFYHSDGGFIDSNVLSGLVGLRYSF